MFKKTLAAVSLLALASGAFAGTVSLTQPDNTHGSYSSGVLSTYSKNQSFKAELLSGQTYTISFNFVGSPANKKPISFTDAWVSFDGDGTVDSSLAAPLSFNSTSASGSFTFTVPTLLSNNGKRVLDDKIFLNVSSLFPKNDGYSASITVTPVPEPASTALFLAGLGALGLMSRRRQSRS